MTYDELLKSFGEKLGGGLVFEPDEAGAVTLSVDGMPVTILGLEEVGQVVLTGVVGETPPEDRMERLYKALLQANHNFAATAGATMSVDPADDRISLCKALPLALADAESFFAEVERFVNTLETWRKIVSDFRGQEIEPGGDPEASAMAGEPDFPRADGFMQV